MCLLEFTISDFKRKIWTCIGIWISDLQPGALPFELSWFSRRYRSKSLSWKVSTRMQGVLVCGTCHWLTSKLTSSLFWYFFLKIKLESAFWNYNLRFQLLNVFELRYPCLYLKRIKDMIHANQKISSSHCGNQGVRRVCF